MAPWQSPCGYAGLLFLTLAFSPARGITIGNELRDDSRAMQTRVVPEAELDDEDVTPLFTTMSQHLDEDLANALERVSFRADFDTDEGMRAEGLADDDMDEGPPLQRRGFARFDADGSGGFDRRELAAFLKTIRTVAEDDLQALWQKADLDGNAEIDFDEFLDCVVSSGNCYRVEEYEQKPVANLLRTTPEFKVEQFRAEKKAKRRQEALYAQGHLLAEDAVLVESNASEAASVGNRSAKAGNRTGPAKRPPMRLHLMTDKGLNSGVGAVCLDGSDAAFYLSPAVDPKFAGKWLFLIEGGAWCAGAAECLARADTEKGSTRNFTKFSDHGGIMSSNCKVNPHFCNFNHVVLSYCDGTSFTGDRAMPLMVNGSNGTKRPLYFRGKRILDAVMDTLLTKHGLNRSEEVLLAGCSAGGMSALVHADHVNAVIRARAPFLSRFRVMPLSGMFLKHNSVENQATWPTYIYRMAFLANSTFAVNRRCAAHMPGRRWACLFPETSYAFTESPVFLINSAFDWYSGLCVFFTANSPVVSIGGSCGRSHARAHYPCAQNVERCSPFEVYAVNQYIRDFSSTLEASEAFSKAGNGAFIHSCHTHCEALEDAYWKGMAVRGVTMQQAALRWWKSDGAPSAQHSYQPCLLKQGGRNGEDWPYQCNPSCLDFTM